MPVQKLPVTSLWNKTIDKIHDANALGIYVYILRKDKIDIKKIMEHFQMSEPEVEVFLHCLVDLKLVELKNE